MSFINPVLGSLVLFMGEIRSTSILTCLERLFSPTDFVFDSD